MIPNIVHFIFGLKKDFGGVPFSFMHFLSVYTAFKVHRPERIYFHYQYEPTGEWWSKAKPYLTLSKVEAPTEIFGNPITHFAHKADVIRLEKLIQHGGIYMDIDVLSVNSFEPLLENSAVLGAEHGAGLCNAVILSEKEGEFVSLWYDQYKSFDSSQWDYHSVTLPLQLSKEHPHLLHQVDEYSFFYPMFNDPSRYYFWPPSSLYNDIKNRLRILRQKDFTYMRHLINGREWQYNKICKSYCLHLWEQSWFTEFLQDITPDRILSDSSNFSRLMRRIFTKEELLAMRSTER